MYPLRLWVILYTQHIIKYDEYWIKVQYYKDSEVPPLIRTLDFAQKFTHSIDWSDYDRARGQLEACHAFLVGWFNSSLFRNVSLNFDDGKWHYRARNGWHCITKIIKTNIKNIYASWFLSHLLFSSVCSFAHPFRFNTDRLGSTLTGAADAARLMQHKQRGKWFRRWCKQRQC